MTDRFRIGLAVVVVLGVISRKMLAMHFSDQIYDTTEDTVTSTIRSPAVHPTVSRPVDSNSSSYSKHMTSACHRGDSGKWIRNWTYPKENHFVPNNSLYISLYEPSPEAPYRWEESWAWRDDCATTTSIIDREGFCRTCHELDISRVFFGGDSITGLHYHTLLYLLKNPAKHERFYHNIVTISCGLYDNPDVSILFGRFDRDIYQLQENYSNFVSQNTLHKTLIILNIGAHFGQVSAGRLPAYQNQTRWLLTEWITERTKPSDIIFYRASVPGHVYCEPNVATIAVVTNETWRKGFRTEPIANYQAWKREFDLNANSKTGDPSIRQMGWYLFEEFNAYTQQYISTNNKNLMNRTIHYLNVFNMTILRPDGHNGNNGFFNDCLHYIIPGPVDWWVHLLYSSLLDML